MQYVNLAIAKWSFVIFLNFVIQYMIDKCMTTYRPDMEEAKEVHKCLKIAAGVFTYVKVSLEVHQSSSRLQYDKCKNSAHYVVRHYFTVVNNNLFSSSTWWKLIDHIFCGVYVIHINDVSFSFVPVYKICCIVINDVNIMLFVHALNRMIWLDDSLTIQRMQ